MDIKIQKKIDKHTHIFKENIKNKMVELDLLDNTKCVQLLQYIYDSENIKVSNEDFMKRKRNKNIVENTNRCLAKKTNGEQCSRRRKSGLFCGTHIDTKDIVEYDNKIEEEEDNKKETTKNVVYAVDISGILYYVDNEENVYMTEDILTNKNNPRIIAKYTKENNKYHIPEYGI